MMNMAEKLNILMKQHNIKNPKELSEKLSNKNLKIPYTTLLTIINNDVQDIKLNTARKLCDFFNITLDDLLDDEIELEDVRMASFNGVDTDGLDETDIEEVNRFIETFIRPRKNKDNK